MEAGPSEPTYESLRDAAVSGVRWMVIARVLGEGGQLIASIALARLITPAEFGHAVIALILVPLSSIITFEGFASALVQRKEIEAAHLQTAMLASLAAGALLSALTFLLAPLVAVPLFGERTSELTQLASPLFLLAGICAVSRAMLWRELRFRSMSLIESGSIMAGAVAAVTLAATGMEGEAIVLGALVTGVAASVMLLLAVPPPRPRWRRRELRQIVGFGAPASGAGLLHVAITNVDYTILAARLSSAQVGFYWRGFQLGVVHQDKISGIMLRLAFPIYSRTGSLAEMGALHERATRVHGAVVVPLLAILIVTAPVLIPWLFGARWEPAVVPTQILAVAGMIAAILTGFAQVLLAAGRPRALMRFNVILLAVYAVAVMATASQGIVTVAIAVVGVYILQLIAVYAVLFRRVVGIRVGGMISDLAPAVVGGLALLAAGFPLAHLLEGAGAPPGAVIAAVAAVGLSIHCVVLRLLFPAVWHDLFSLVRRVLPTRPSVPAPGGAGALSAQR
jgi:lipopolysaccharide exporter